MILDSTAREMIAAAAAAAAAAVDMESYLSLSRVSTSIFI